MFLRHEDEVFVAAMNAELAEAKYYRSGNPTFPVEVLPRNEAPLPDRNRIELPVQETALFMSVE